MSFLNPGVIALLVTMLIWGLTYIGTKVALQEFKPFTLTVLRLLIAWLVLSPFARREGYRLRDTWQPKSLALGFTGVALFYTLQTLGVNYTSAASAALFQAGLPALTAFFAYLVLRERVNRLKIIGYVLSFLGVAVITVTGASDSSQDSLLGNSLMLASLLAWVAYTLLGKRISTSYSATRATTVTMGSGLIFLIPFGAIELWANGLPQVSLPGWLALIYLALGGSATAYFLWNYGLQRLDANRASPFINLIPVIGLLGAWLWGEPVSLFQLAGGSLAIVGVWLSNY